MPDLTATLIAAYVSSFRDYQARVRRLADGLSDAQFWARPYPYGNSVGHLVLHLTGNLRFYVGRHIAGFEYTRDRRREFFDPDPPSKAEAVRLLDEAIDLTVSTLERQTDADWTAPFAAAGADGIHDRFSMFLRVAAHFHHHAGQMIYLVKEHERQESGRPEGLQRPTAIRFAHTNLVARDWRTLGGFYERALGCTRLLPERDLAGDWVERGTGVVGARVTGAHYRLPGSGDTGPTLEIFQYHPSIDAPPAPANRIGFGHLAFAVPDVAMARAAVLAAGGSAVGSIETPAIEGAGRITWCYVRDPEGNIIELQRRDEALA